MTQLPGAVGTEVEEDDRVTVLDATALAAIEDRGGRHELVGDSVRVLPLDVGHRVDGGPVTCTGDDLVGAGDAVPAPIAVHREIPAGDRGDGAHPSTVQIVAETPDEPGGARRRLVAPIEKGMEPQRCQAPAAGQLGKRDGVILMTVHATRRDETQTMQRGTPLAGPVHRLAECQIAEEAPISDP